MILDLIENRSYVVAVKRLLSPSFTFLFAAAKKIKNKMEGKLSAEHNWTMLTYFEML